MIAEQTMDLKVDQLPGQSLSALLTFEIISRPKEKLA
jgi:hypothetical protein